MAGVVDPAGVVDLALVVDQAGVVDLAGPVDQAVVVDEVVVADGVVVVDDGKLELVPEPEPARLMQANDMDVLVKSSSAFASSDQAMLT